MSSETTISQMKKTIALFDGWKLIPGDPNHVCPSCDEGKVPSGWCNCHLKTTRFLKDGSCQSITYFQYHSSWDWLMLVGKKIYDLLADMLKKRPPHTACHGDLIEVDISCHFREYNLQKAHASIYEFIKWYNQSTQSNEQTTTEGN